MTDSSHSSHSVAKHDAKTNHTSKMKSDVLDVNFREVVINILFMAVVFRSQFFCRHHPGMPTPITD